MIGELLLWGIGCSGGMVVAAGLYAFFVEVGVISDFAIYTRTTDHIGRYGACVALGGMLGNLFSLFPCRLFWGRLWLSGFALISGIFVGCWAMALAETLQVFPIFLKKGRWEKFVSWFVLSIALGKVLGAVVSLF